MFIGYYEQDNKAYFNIYYNNCYGWRKWQEDTFSPSTNNIRLLDFTIKGTKYQDKKSNLRELATTYQNNFSMLAWSYSELATINNYFEKMGRRFGLIEEFKENGVI